MKDATLVMRIVHRHAGGLEIRETPYFLIDGVHRHAGGLEICGGKGNAFSKVHRHAGGLEK